MHVRLSKSSDNDKVIELSLIGKEVQLYVHVDIEKVSVQDDLLSDIN